MTKIDYNHFSDIFSLPVKKKASRVDKMIQLAKDKGLYMYRVVGGYEIDDGNGSTAVCKNLNECEIEIQIMGG